MRRVPDLRIQVAPLIVSVILSRSKVSRRGLARALLPSVVPELPIRSRIFAPEGCLSQVAGAVTGSLVNTNILFGRILFILLPQLLSALIFCLSVFKSINIRQILWPTNGFFVYDVIFPSQNRKSQSFNFYI